MFEIGEMVCHDDGESVWVGRFLGDLNFNYYNIEEWSLTERRWILGPFHPDKKQFEDDIKAGIIKKISAQKLKTYEIKAHLRQL